MLWRAIYILMLLIAASSMGHAETTPVAGSLVGRLMDAHCSAPIRYANVILAGTTMGAMSLADGSFRIDDIPDGVYVVRVLVWGLEPVEKQVVILASQVTRVDFRIPSRWDQKILPKPPGSPPVCSLHGTPTQWVLAPTDAATFDHYHPDNPNAWPHFPGEYRRGATKAGWGGSCPRCVAGENSRDVATRHSRILWRGLVSHPDSGWRTYSVRRAITFRAPRGLADSVYVDSCRVAGRWKGRDVVVKIQRNGRWIDTTGDYRVHDVVGDCMAIIDVKADGSTARVVATLTSTTNSIDDTQIAVTASGSRAMRTVCSILASVRFPAPTQ